VRQNIQQAIYNAMQVPYKKGGIEESN